MWLTLEQTADAASSLTPTWRNNSGLDYESNHDHNSQNSRYSSQNFHPRLPTSPSLHPPQSSSVYSSSPSQSSDSRLPNSQDNLVLRHGGHPSPSLPPPSPRARFADNPIIGPTRGPSPQLHRRKSALKSSSPLPKRMSTNVYMVDDGENAITSSHPSIFDTEVNFSTSDPKQRQRTLSVALTGPKAVAESSQRARSMSVSSPSAASPDVETAAVQAYERNRIKTLTGSNPSALAGFVMGKDELFREQARRNLGLLSNPEGRDDPPLTEPKDSQTHQTQRPPSPTPSASSSLSSSSSFDMFATLNSANRSDSDQSISRPRFMVRPLKLRPPVLPPSLAPDPVDPSNSLVSFSSASPAAEDRNHPSERRPSTGGRQRSGTLVAPKKPKPPLSLPMEASSSTSHIPPVPRVPNIEHLPAPPPRPPRSSRRNNQALSVNLTAMNQSTTSFESFSTSHSHSEKENRPSEKVDARPLVKESRQPTKTPRPSTALSSGPSRPSSKKPTDRTQHRPTPSASSITSILVSSDSNSTLGKGGTSSLSVDKQHSSQISLSQGQTTRASSFNSLPQTQKSDPRPGARAVINTSGQSGTDQISRHHLPVISPKPVHPDSSSTRFRDMSSGTDDDDFQSADEGDEYFWVDPNLEKSEEFDPQSSISPDLNEEYRNLTGTSSYNSLQSPFEQSFGSSSGYQSPPSRNHWGQPYLGTSHTIIGAFPRSDSMLSSSYSIASMYQTSQPHDPLQDSLSSMAERSDRLLNDLVSAERPSTPCTYSKSNSEAKVGKQPAERPSSIATAAVHVSPSPHPGGSERLLTPYSADRGHPRPASFINSDISRASSIEGLAALRNGNSPGAISNPKKPNSRSSHFRQISNMLTSRSRDSSVDGESSSPRQPISKAPNRKPISTYGSPMTVPSGPSGLHAMLPPQTWKASTPPDEYKALLDQYGAMEMRRQEVIWELCETELTFVDGLRRVIDIFASPLRTPHGTWIDGVPATVAKLLDWLEDIVNLHAEMSAMTERYRLRQTHTDGLVLRIADAFLKFVSRLEVHQAYLVRFSEVTASIEAMTCDIESDFGEFVRMQTSLPDCGHMNLPSFLLKPVQRLMKYPLFYKQLCDLTPATHPDHASTFTLLHAVDSVIRVLQEVKGREDEYENLKLLQTRIKGLPPGFQLAQRDRRLLAQGLLRRVQVSSRELADLELDVTHHYTKAHDRHHRIRPSMSTQSQALSHRTSLAFHFVRPLSQTSDHSELSQQSIHSKGSTPSISDNSPSSLWAGHSAPSSDEFVHPLTPSSTEFSPQSTFNKNPQRGASRSESLFGGFTSLRDVAYNHHPGSEHSPETRTRQRTITTSRLMKRAKESPVHVFVFTDLVILATRHNDGVRLIRSSRLPLKKKEHMAHYNALESIGLSRPVVVDDVSGELGYEHLVKLDLVPIATTAGMNEQDLSSSTVVFLTFPDRLPGSRHPAAREVVEKEKSKWLAALAQCLRSPLRKTKGYASVSNDSKKRSSRNLSMARSPSDPSLWEASMEEQEREERNWWMVRHREVKREMENKERLRSEEQEGVVAVGRPVGRSEGLSRNASVVHPPRQRSSVHLLRRESLRSKPILESPGLGLKFNCV